MKPFAAELLGGSRMMQNIRSQIAKIAPGDAVVLIRGEPGTGKELTARMIRKNSARAEKTFLCVNCSALPDELIERELFGCENGEKEQDSPGKIEAADGGTLFLEEVSKLNLPVQIKLLRFIQERVYCRVGSAVERTADVRLIIATSRSLEKLMEQGRFREDLYYRLNVFPIYLPPLYSRKSDILQLAEYFLDGFAKRYGKKIRRISTPAINMLMAYHWPGNVQELENCMERAVLNASEDVIHGYDLPPTLQTGEASGTAAVPPGAEVDFSALVSSFERELIVESLKNNRGNVAASARQLGLSQRILHYKIGKLGIRPEWYKNRQQKSSEALE